MNDRNTQDSARTIAVAATFTAEPIERTLAFWIEALDLDARVAFAPYGHAVQALVARSAPMARDGAGCNVVLLRLEDWGAPRRGERCANGAALDPARLRDNVDLFVRAFGPAAETLAAPMILVVCPPSPALTASEPDSRLLCDLEERLARELGERSQTRVVTSREVTTLYGVQDYYLPAGEHNGHVPYTSAMYTALGTVVARYAFQFLTPRPKVVALDCDDTLWEGICAERGPDGVSLSPQRRAFQEMLVDIQRRGVLLCLCSKNDERDVRDVFTSRTEPMPLSTSHFVATRVNWRPKSDNLASLAEELGLGLDAFAFVDDNPLECAAVQSRWPEVATVRIPSDPNRLEGWLRHVWLFDGVGQTREDASRTELYRRHAKRAQLRDTVESYADFLAGLDLTVDIRPMAGDEVARVAQLEARTNQFNTTSTRRSEVELGRMCRDGGYRCLVVEVADRFGEYGLVGAALYSERYDVAEVDSFLLSCRALGRGVEHRMLARIGEEAVARGLDRLAVPLVPTPRNEPAQRFLERVAGPPVASGDNLRRYEISARAAASCRFDPAEQAAEPDSAVTERRNARSSEPGKGVRAATLGRIPTDLDTVEKIEAEVAIREMRARPFGNRALVPPRDGLERYLVELLRKTLGVDELGVDDDFFESGGTSLLATLAVNTLQADLGEIMFAAALFEATTAADLAAYLRRHYPTSAARLGGRPILKPRNAAHAADCGVDEGTISGVVHLVRERWPSRRSDTMPSRRNGRVVFVLAPPRSGSTLLRVILAGHPKLFAPPELELLGFADLGARAKALEGGARFWREGMIRAWMELRSCDARTARAEICEIEERSLPTPEVYGLLQSALGDRTLVDKTPSYAFDPRVLARAERWFDDAYFVHLVRHPLAVALSFERSRLDRVFLPNQTRYSPREIGEALWVLAHRNIIRFLDRIPARRQIRLHFEDLVGDPDRETSRVCATLGLDFVSSMTRPYDEPPGSRMTDGLYPGTRMLGDVHFASYTDIDPSRAAPHGSDAVVRLGAPATALARQFGYGEVCGGVHERLAAHGAAGV